ncbi:hypothetical protein BDV97DRAFT_346933 [Delphinella strobiligena]|nr:hypothetical protein BDV97DRAFT_346933 [Delphinella strobiligena]
MSSPPLSPIRQYIPSIEPRGHRRPSSSHSNNRSSATPRSSFSGHRLSHSSHYSNGTHDLAPPLDGNEHAAGASAGGNLADELEFADEDDEEWDEPGVDEGISGADATDRTWDAVHDHNSGVDVAYKSSSSFQQVTSSPRPQSKQQTHRNFSRPMSRDSEVESPSDLFSLEMEDAMTAIAQLANPPSQHQSGTISKALAALQNLTPHTTLESHTQRLTTSTNSLSSHLTQQTRIIASLSSCLFSPFGLAAPLDLAAIDEIIPHMTQVLQDLPLPDPRALQGLSKLDRETTDLLRTLTSLTDSIQMGKQNTSSAARHLRNTHTMVTQLRRENDLSEQAKWKIEKEGWESKLAERWCARECSDVVGGFEQVCEGLRRGLEESMAAA